jgi:hypothetical protein
MQMSRARRVASAAKRLLPRGGLFSAARRNESATQRLEPCRRDFLWKRRLARDSGQP